MLCAAAFVVAVLAGAAASALPPAPSGVRAEAKGSLARGGCVAARAVLEDGREAASVRLCNDTAATGWYRQRTNTSGSVSDVDQMFAAGFLEGYASQPLILQAFENFPPAPPSPKVDAWFERYDAWLAARVNAGGNGTGNGDEHYWTHTGLVYRQLQGLYSGYKARCAAEPASCPGTPKAWLDFVKLTPSVMDVVESVMPAAQRTQWTRLSAPDAALLAARDTHCSALVVLPSSGTADAYVGHTTWGMYSSMIRVAKTLRTALAAPSTAAQQLTYSSYPGYLYSGDDFYVTSAGLAVLETTLNVFNTSLYDRLTPEGVVLTWTRGVVASRMSATAPAWAATFALYNSGTYNNQWMAVDYKRVGLAGSGVLQVLEQAPGAVAHWDATASLAAPGGYWPSYNIPANRDMFALLGYGAMVDKFGDPYSYERAPRAQIFRRNATDAAASPAAARALMRYNDWRNDPLSLGQPSNAISSRFDLTVPVSRAVAMGGIDSKLATRAGVLGDGGFAAVTGPTWGGASSVGVFDWASSPFANASHVGVPASMGFSFTNVQ